MPDLDGSSWRRKGPWKPRPRSIRRQRFEDGIKQTQSKVDLAFDCVDDAQVARDGVWAHEDEEVGEMRDHGAEVGLRDALGRLVPL